MPELFAPTIEDQIACVTREVAMRKSVYGRRVAEGKMNQEYADREIARMEAVLATLQAVKRLGAAQASMRTDINGAD